MEIHRVIISISFVFALCCVVSGQGAGVAEYRDPLPLYYDSVTGNATVDLTNVTDGTTAGYTLSVASICNDPCAAFRPENHTPFMGSTFVTANADTIGESNFSGVPGGVYSLGNVFPINLSEAELTAYFTRQPVFDLVKYFVIGPVGSGAAHAFQPIYSPSPFPTLNDVSIGPESFAEQWATESTLSYNPANGELSIDSTGDQGGALFSYEIEFDSPIVNETNFVQSHNVGEGDSDVSTDRIFEVSWSGISAGLHSLGNVLPSGLSEVDFESSILHARFLGEPGHDVASFDIESSGFDMTLRFIPEPRSSVAAVYGLVLVLLICRR